MLRKKSQFILVGMLVLAGVAKATSRSLLDRGLDEARSGDCPSAEADLRKAILENPREAAAYTAIGACEINSRHPERATDNFKAAARLQPQAWQTWNNLGANYLTLNHPKIAAETFKKAIAINPNAVSAWFNLGSSQLRSGNKVEAFYAVDRAQQLDSKDASITKAWIEVASILATDAGDAIDKGQYQAAFTMLTAVKRPLNGTAAWNNLMGYTDFKLKKFEEAKGYLETALQMEPDNEGYLLDVGDFLAARHAYDEAVKFFEIGVARMPHSAPVRFGLAISYTLESRTKEAITLLEQLHIDYPDWGLVDRALGECYEANQNWSAMIKLGKSLHLREPGNAVGWYLEGAGRERIANRDGGSLAEAIVALHQATTLAPSLGRYHLQLGKALEENKEHQNAIAELKEAILLDSKDAGAHYALARAYKQAGEAKLAAQEYRLVSGIKAKSAHDVYVSMLTETQHPRQESAERGPR